MVWKTVITFAMLLIIPIGSVYADELTREEKIEKYGNEAKEIYLEKEAEKDPEKKAELEKRLEGLIFMMNELGVPTQEQVDENPKYWILRAHDAKKEAKERENALKNVLYGLSPIQFSEETGQMKFNLPIIILVIGFSSALLIVIHRYMSLKAKLDSIR